MIKNLVAEKKEERNKRRLEKKESSHLKVSISVFVKNFIYLPDRWDIVPLMILRHSSKTMNNNEIF